MGRRPRIEYEGAIYHVIQRGNNQEYIFADDSDKAYLLKQIDECRRGLGFRLFGYVVMGNHYHLLLKTERKPLSKIMHRINGNFARHFNLKYQRSGHVFQGRYKAILIQDERYLLAVLRYIHRNPVAAGVSDTTTDYAYSSDNYYRRQQGWPVDIDMVLDCLADDRLKALEKYQELMAQEDDTDYEDQDVIGEESFSMTVRPRTEVAERKPLDAILMDIGASPDDYQQIKAGSRRRHLTPYKRRYIEFALEQKYTLKEIGENIGLTANAVFDLWKRQ
ncbi:MAG: transposase [Bacillota bacterium]|jgi:REP element-mobilizing transposase RayT|uniref:REP-associated tyrosine transposase n=1 Tax=Desulforudis sp. DRI-14 TaxID=3459793 RepID=UPI003471DDD6